MSVIENNGVESRRKGEDERARGRDCNLTSFVSVTMARNVRL